MNKAYAAAGFVLGALVGSGIAYYICKKKYENLANEEFKARRKEASEKRQEEKKEEAPEPVGDKQASIRSIHEKPNIMEYAERISKEGYTDYSGTKEVTKRVIEPDSIPYVIPPETFDEGKYDGFEQISLTYYADGVVADDADDMLEDAESIVGDDFAEHYGDYEEDVVYVRNEARRTDYEICKDNRTYEEVSGKKPHRVEI